MASLYTYPEQQGRARFVPAAWTEKHGERAVDLAWKQATHGDPPGDTQNWLASADTFPTEIREECQGLYHEALVRMRPYLLEQLRSLRADASHIYGQREDGDGGFVRDAPPSAEQARRQLSAAEEAREALDDFCREHPGVVRLEEAEQRRRTEEHAAQRAANEARRAAFREDVRRARGTPEAAPEQHVGELLPALKEALQRGVDPALAWYGVADTFGRTFAWAGSWTGDEWKRAKALVHAALESEER